MDNGYIIQLITSLDGSKTADDLKKIEQQLNAKGINIKTSLDTATSKQELQNLAKQLQSVLKSSGLEIDTSKILSAFNQVYKEAEIMANKVNKIQLLSNGGIKNDYSTQISVLTSNFQKLGLTEEEIQAKTSNVSTAFDALKKRLSEPFNESNYQEIIALNDKLQYELIQSSNEFTKLKASSNTISTSALTSQKAIDSLANSMLTFKNNNTAMTKEMKQSLSSMYNTLINGANLSKTEVDDLRHRFNQLKIEVRDSGKLGKSFGDSIKQGMASFSAWLPASMIIMRSIYAVRNMISGVKELDTELVDLKKTTNATTQELENFYYESNDTAKQLGVTTKEIISQTSEWSRLGYAIKDAQTMAKNSAIFEAISPDLSIQEATDGLVSSLKAYKIEAEDSLDGIISKINIIGNTQAVSNGDIVDILTRSSSAMAAANNSLEQTIALGTAA